jgi:hypothetical protein
MELLNWITAYQVSIYHLNSIACDIKSCHNKAAVRVETDFSYVQRVSESWQALFPIILLS